MIRAELISQYGETGDDREVPIGAHMLELPAPTDWPSEALVLGSPYFVLFVSANVAQFSVEQWSTFVDRAMDAGCSYVCTWGPGCEKLHDIFDEECVHRDPDATSDRFLMTTWHDEPLDDALWFALFSAIPPDDTVFFGKTSTIVACSVGGYSASELRMRLQDVDAFSERVLADKPD